MKITETKSSNEWTYEFELRFVQGEYLCGMFSKKEKSFIEGCIAYSAAKNIRGEKPIFEWQHVNNMEILGVFLDTTKSRSDDLTEHFDDFWNDLWTYLEQGHTPIRKEDKTSLVVAPLEWTEENYELVVFVLTDNETVLTPAKSANKYIVNVDFTTALDVPYKCDTKEQLLKAVHMLVDTICDNDETTENGEPYTIYITQNYKERR